MVNCIKGFLKVNQDHACGHASFKSLRDLITQVRYPLSDERESQIGVHTIFSFHQDTFVL